MADPKHGSRMLLSMLGVELSPGALLDAGGHYLSDHPHPTRMPQTPSNFGCRGVYGLQCFFHVLEGPFAGH
eukprot:5371991-Pyramimonas_sp.AAC.1